MSPPMRLVLAARLSQLAKGQTGLDTQDEDARAWAAGHGHTIIATAPDRISGRVPAKERPNLGPWLNDPKRMALYDGILVAKIDRLTRKRDWDIRQWAEENGKKILVVQPELQWPPEPGDLATSIIWDNLVNLAAGEWENTSIRYLRMQRALREQAFFVGKPPYGYRIVTVDGTEHKTLEPDSVTGAIVQGMARRYIDSQSLSEIAEWLTTSAIPVPQQPKGREGRGWTAQAVRRTLRNQAIAGRLQTKGKTVLRMEPLISIEEFRTIQALMASRAHRGPAKDTALLTGMLRCDNGTPMYRVQGRRIPSVPDGLYYYCRECPKGERLLAPMTDVHQKVHEAVMELADVWNFVPEITLGDDYSEEIDQVKRDISELDPEANDYDTKLQAFRSALKELRKLPSKPAKVDYKYDGRTIGEVWESLKTTDDKRKFLQGHETNLRAKREPDGSISVTGFRLRIPAL